MSSPIPTPALRSALWNHLHVEHGLKLIESELDEIIIKAQGVAQVAPAPVEQARGELAVLEMMRGWFLMHTSGENCMNTLVDVFTAMRDQLEDDDAMLPMIRGLAHFQSLATENKDRDWALAKEACRRVIHAIGRDHDVGSTGALAIEAIGKAFPEFDARASTGKGDGK